VAVYEVAVDVGNGVAISRLLEQILSSGASIQVGYEPAEDGWYAEAESESLRERRWGSSLQEALTNLRLAMTVDWWAEVVTGAH
jgi:hypothetical protein